MLPVFAQIEGSVELGLLLLTGAILIGPVIAERLRIPGLVGLIFIGTLMGPFALGWLRTGGLVATVGAAGLLYLMFIAGIELDLKTFVDNRNAAITFGLLTFVFPFGLSYLVGSTYLGYGVAASALVGAMWASHTLVAYPEVKSAGVDWNRAVGIGVAATVITDVLALIVLAVAVSEAGAASGEAGHEALLPLWLGVIVLGAFTLWVLPRVTRWFFVNVGHTRTQRFIVVLAGMSAGAVVSLLGGIEGLVGAFLAGIGINRLVPTRGGLMERIDFFGSALFVPAFLVSVGLSIDPRALVEASTVWLALIFTALVVVGKVAAAGVSGAVFKLSFPEVGVLASLTLGQAAATLAIAQVGVSTGIFDQQILNAAVLTVVLTVILTSLGTRFFAGRLTRPTGDAPALGANVLVHITGESISNGTLQVASALAQADGGIVTPYTVSDSAQDATAAHLVEEAVDAVVKLGHDSEGATRLSSSFPEGSVNLAVEQKASLILLPWDGPRFPSDFVFGNSIDEVGRDAPVSTAALHLVTSEWSRVIVVTGRFVGLGTRTADTKAALRAGIALARSREAELVVYTPEHDDVDDLQIDDGTVNRYTEGDGSVLQAVEPGDLVVVPVHVVNGARRFGQRRLARAFSTVSLMVIGGPRRLVVSGRSTDRLAVGAVTGRTSFGIREARTID